MSKVEKLDVEARNGGKEDVLFGLMARPATSKPKGGSLIQEVGFSGPPSVGDVPEGDDTGEISVKTILIERLLPWVSFSLL